MHRRLSLEDLTALYYMLPHCGLPLRYGYRMMTEQNDGQFAGLDSNGQGQGRAVLR
jgi:hypothetical protein